MSSSENQPERDLSGAGLGATGKTADQFAPGQESPGTTYGDPGGTDTVAEESTQVDPQAEAGEDSDGAPA